MASTGTMLSSVDLLGAPRGWRWLVTPTDGSFRKDGSDFPRPPGLGGNPWETRNFLGWFWLGCSNLEHLFIYFMLHTQQTLTNRFLGMGSEAIGKHWKCWGQIGHTAGSNFMRPVWPQWWTPSRSAQNWVHQRISLTPFSDHPSMGDFVCVTQTQAPWAQRVGWHLVDYH